MKRLMAAVFVVTSLAPLSVAGSPVKNELVYQYPRNKGEKKFWLCPVDPKTAGWIRPMTGEPWDGCTLYDKATDIFRAGGLVQLWIVDYPLLSQFAVKVKDEMIFTPNLPFIRGVSEAVKVAGSPGEGVHNIAGEEPPDVDVKNFDASEATNLEALIHRIEQRDRDALREAARILSGMQVEAKKTRNLPGNVAAIQPVKPVRTLIEGAAQEGAPGPGVQGILTFTTGVTNDLTKLVRDKSLNESSFQRIVSDTKRLIAGVTDYNAQFANLDKDGALGKADEAMSQISAKYFMTARFGPRLLLAAVKGFGNIATVQIEASMGKSQASTPVDEVLTAFMEKYHAKLDDSPLPGTAGDAVRTIALNTAEASLWMYDSQQWDKAYSALNTRAAELNGQIAALFTEVNNTYRDYRVRDPQVIPIKQWSASTAANLEITEVRGFQPFVLGNSTVQTPVVPPPVESAAPDTTLNIPGPADVKITISTNNGTTPAPAPAGGQSSLAEVVPVRIHRFARANLISGFAYSFLRTKEYGIGNVGLNNAAGQPLLDANGGQRSIRTAVETRSQPHQLHYYAGLNFYFTQRDLYPGATGKKKTKEEWISSAWMPGLMLAYGISQEFNILTGVNWETPWGLNFGVGYHLGQETGLGNFGKGQVAIADSVTVAPTVQKFAYKPFLSIGFDASVFSKVWGSVKGIK